MTRTLVTGATGTLGTALRQRLAESGHEVRAASRSPLGQAEEDIHWVELDLVEGSNFESALENVDIVIHAATAPQGNTEAVDVRGTERLLEAAEEVGVENFLYPSIVGIEKIPFSYYQHKLAAETAVKESDIPTTIVRSTQFHSFVAEILGYVAKVPVWPLPTKMQLQPIDVREVADIVVENATPSKRSHTDFIGGPEVYTVRDLAKTYRNVRGLSRPIIRFPIPSKTVSAFNAGHATCPEYRGGSYTWEEWLAEQYGNGVYNANSRIQSPTRSQ